MRRRALLHSSAALLLPALAGCATRLPDHARVVVVGGGFAGATAAKYIRLFSGQRVEVVLVEPNAVHVSCPASNLVLGGSRVLADLTRGYSLASAHGVRQVRDLATAIDPARRQVALAGGATVRYDKLVLAPGIDLQLDRVEGLAAAHAEGRMLHAWKAGAETLALRRQLEAMPDGGVVAIAIPEAPYRCPPGPYERACQVAWYLRQAKPRSKVIVVDANPDITSKPALFRKAWAELYPGMIEYRPQHKLVGVDGRAGMLRFEVQDDLKADVANVLPPMRAGQPALQAGLANLAGGRWCGVDFLTFASTLAPDIHVLGDAIQVAPAMPKSAHMANAHAKVAAAAIVAEFAGLPPDPAPMLTNTCYSYVSDTQAIHVASVHAYVREEKTFRAVAGAGGLSTAPSALEGRHAWSWAQTIWADSLG